jgi:amino acid adenylation domain-containing protein
MSAEMSSRKLAGNDFRSIDIMVRNQGAQISAANPAQGPARIPRCNRTGPLAVSGAQQRIWFLEKLQRESSAYNSLMVFRLTGPLEVGLLRRALNEIVDRHESLRTTFYARNGEVFQLIHALHDVGLPVVELRGAPDEDQVSDIARRAAAEFDLGFDLAHDPPLRATLLRYSSDQHVLILAMHHIATDGWSQGVFWKELSALYAAFINGLPSPLANLPIQYADFAEWQNDTLQGDYLNRLLEFWKAGLSGIPEQLELPTDRPRPPAMSFRGAKFKFALSARLTADLRALGHGEGATLFMVLLGAWQVLLSRYSGQQDVVVGSPIAGRNGAETEALIGCFVNTLALRTDLSGNPTFRELLRRVRKITFDAFSHQDLPFERLVEEIQPNRSLNRSPLFQVMLVLQNAPSSPAELAGLEVTRIPVENPTAKFDLTLTLRAMDGGLQGSLEYCTELFDSGTIARLAGQFQVLLQAIVSDPGQRIEDVPLLTEAERQRILVEWNQTATDFPRDNCVHELFEAQAARTPEAVAVEFQEQRLTYQELNERANRLAGDLFNRGVGWETLVGLCVEPSLETIVGILGILKAGGAYVPLDPEYPASRLSLMLVDAAPVLVLTTHSLRNRLPAGIAMIDLDTATAAVASDLNRGTALRNSERIAPVGPQHPAYVIYTSGSTGAPKGVHIEHRALVNHMSWMVATYPVAPGDRVLSRTSISFDASVWEIWFPLLSGATLCLAPRNTARDPGRLLKFMADRGITVAQFVPTLLAAICEQGRPRPERLRLVFAGGEPLVRELAQSVFSGWQVPIVNLYGPTETTIQSTHFMCRDTVPDTPTVPIGRPIWNTVLYVLDRQGVPAPIGVPGELYIGGVGLARGYLNQPELTAAKFVPDPFSAAPHERLYRTGDRVRWREDGTLEFLGRVDQQVKLRGFRIELGEIEATLRGHPGVGQGLVLLREDRPGDKRLVAYVVPREPDQPPAVSELRQHLLQSLPEYAVPSNFVTLDALPLTPNGKVDRNSLPAPSTTQVELQSSAVPAITSTEAQLILIWEDLLLTRPVRVDDNFFDLGGHSLLAVRLLSRIKEVFNQDLSLQAFFWTPTVRSMAQLLAADSEIRSWPPLIPIQPKGSRPPLFCIAAPNVNALGFAFLARHLDPDQPVYGLQLQDVTNPERFYTQAQYESLAAASIRLLQSVAPTGPYHLCGFCEGAHIAFEMARQLDLQGQPIGLLGILDAWPLENTTNWFRHRLEYWRKRWWLRIRSGRLSNAHRFLYRQLRRLSGRWSGKMLNVILSRGGSEAMTAQAPVDAGQLRWKQRMWPGKDFVAPVFHGRITVFRVRRQPFVRVSDPELGWKVRTDRGVEVHELPGTHTTLLREPHVAVLAEKLADCIAGQRTAPIHRVV